MTTYPSGYQPGPLDRHAAERLLTGVRVPSRADRLAQRLAAAATTPFPEETAGEPAALAAFRAAATPISRRASMFQTALAKLLTVKAAVLLGLTAASGVAVAATTGVLPNPIRHDPPSTAQASANPADHPSGPRATPSPSLVGLCHAFLAGAGSEHGKALDSPAFTALITAAGGRDSVETFCVDLLGEQATPDPDSSGHPTGPPSEHPTGPPFPHPTGQPSPLPNN